MPKNLIRRFLAASTTFMTWFAKSWIPGWGVYYFSTECTTANEMSKLYLRFVCCVVNFYLRYKLLGLRTSPSLLGGVMNPERPTRTRAIGCIIGD